MMTEVSIFLRHDCICQLIKSITIHPEKCRPTTLIINLRVSFSILKLSTSVLIHACLPSSCKEIATIGLRITVKNSYYLKLTNDLLTFSFFV